MLQFKRVRFKSLALGLFLLQTLSFGNAQVSSKPVPAADLQFAPGKRVSRIPFVRVGNFVYLRARINDSKPLWFLLDSGATASYFDVELAKSLGHDKSIKGATLSLPGLKLLNQNFYLQPWRLGANNGQAAAGLLGYDFINRFVIEIDYLNNYITLHEPSGYKYSGAGEVVPLVLLEDDSGGKVPLVKVKVMRMGHRALEGNFIADTAVRSAITFNTPFVDANKLLQSQQTIQVPIGAGTMLRESNQAIGRLPHIQLGRFKINQPLAVYFQDKEGIVASPEFDGVIGNEILRRFKLIIDYSRQRMILEPTRHLSESEEYDMSGMLLLAEGKDLKTFRVRRLVENSPATVAGVREGDIIYAVDGKPTSNLTLEQVRGLFKHDGRAHRLTLEREGRKLETRIRLRRLI
jgi:hypothetical protein